MKHLIRLDAEVRKVCPAIVGVDAAGDITFRDDATGEQVQAARAVVAAFDDSDAAQAAWEEDRNPERKSLRQQAAQAVADNAAFLAISAPANAQVLAQVKALTRQNNRIIPRLAQLD